MEPEKLRTLIALITIVFLIMPIFMLAYFYIYTKRKKNHLEEKVKMKESFEQEIMNTQQEVREQTMQTIGADLHDNIGQLLSLTTLTLKSIVPASKKVHTSIELLGKAITEMRLLGKLLQGDQLLTMGLDKAIQQEVDWLNRSESYQINFAHQFGSSDLRNPEKDLFCFRMVQEILNNIIKHAKAKHIAISLDTTTNRLLLSISDDGIGFDSDSDDQQGSGLANIRKRAAIVGGTAQIDSALGKGTRITINIPYP